MEPPSRNRIEITNQTGRRLPRALLARAVETTLTSNRLSKKAVQLLICDNREIRLLNRRHRSVNKTTDVLTFPAPSGLPYDARHQFLGEIAISMEYAQEQAALRRVSLSNELACLAIHGALHLCGLEDETEAGYKQMQRKMALLGAKIGVVTDPEWSTLELPGARK